MSGPRAACRTGRGLTRADNAVTTTRPRAPREGGRDGRDSDRGAHPSTHGTTTVGFLTEKEKKFVFPHAGRYEMVAGFLTDAMGGEPTVEAVRIDVERKAELGLAE